MHRVRIIRERLITFEVLIQLQLKRCESRHVVIGVEGGTTVEVELIRSLGPPTGNIYKSKERTHANRNWIKESNTK